MKAASALEAENLEKRMARDKFLNDPDRRADLMRKIADSDVRIAHFKRAREEAANLK